MSQPLLLDAQFVYLYDGTLEGLLTAVFEAFKRREYPQNIVTDHNLQQSMLCSYIPTLTNVAHAERVQMGIINSLGAHSYENVKRVFLSEDERKGGVILRYLQYTLKHGTRARTHLAHPAVNDFEAILNTVNKEAHYMLQFVRFAQLQNGVFFSKIEPRASVVPLIMDHFVSRFNIQPFMIHDAAHGLTGVYDMDSWWLVEASELTLPSCTQQQDDFQALWQTFYDTIAIEERSNPTCRRNFMPKRFWGNMCEMIPRQLRKAQPTTPTPTQVAKQAARALPVARSQREKKADSTALSMTLL
ncbi:MAG: TIGR03915 family putative DNA repair protein [Coriobacteriales bacterium]|jgi:probable DNA metabolism protein|nr:TIGR03915 family putative DNA repair protein [Coriobacteriales bacterium]